MDKATLEFMAKVSYALGVIDSGKSIPVATLDRVSNVLSTALDDFVLEKSGEQHAAN